MNDKVLEFVGKGWKVFPVKPGEKVPATTHGVKEATRCASTVKRWWTTVPEFNIGIACGTESGIVVLDVDGQAGLDSIKLLEAEFGVIPDTYTVRTPSGGYHYYFNAPSEPLKNRVRMLPGLDFRAEGGYVLGEGSQDTLGTKYETISPSPPIDLPPHLLALVQEASTPSPLSTDIEDGVAEGYRNDYLFKAGCRLRRAGFSSNAIAQALTVENEEKCAPPLIESEVERIAQSATKYCPEDPIQADEITSPIISARDLLSPLCTYLQDKERVKGQSYYLPELDNLLGGGMREGEVTAWHAEAKVGKNTLWHKLMHLQLENKQLVGYASRELTPETEVLPNILSIHFKENIWLSDNITPERFGPVLETWPLYFALGYGYFPLDQLQAWIQDLKRRGVTQFWFDHLHYMLEDPEDFKAASRLVKELKTLAKIEDIHINIIIQPNKLMDGQRLSLNSIKGGAAMGQAIDNLFILERAATNVMKVKLERARSKLCTHGKFYLNYDTKTTDLTVVEAAIETRLTEQPGLTEDARVQIDGALSR